MTTPTITCDHCESEIDVEKDPKCVSYHPSGRTEVTCAECRDLMRDLMREGYRIKRGWRA